MSSKNEIFQGSENVFLGSKMIKKVISYVAGWLMRPVKYTFRIGKNGFSKIFRGARRSARILKKRLTSRLKLAKIALCKQNRKALRGRKNG